jgi:ubiquinol-cytochrome c reductase cytochrome b subunit
MVGVVLLLITLAFGLTGYLLPWDNRAYWGTVVTTEIAGQAPGLGRYVQRLMGAEGGVGVVTFARFYAVHTLLLPWLVFTLAALHLYLVRRHGVAPSASDSGPKRKFYPEQALKDLVLIFVAFVILFALAAAVPPSLERVADPTDITYTPRPDWYFLFLFQLLKFLKGFSERLGSVLLPTLAVAALFAVPFIDRARAERTARRTFAIGVVSLSFLFWTTLTVAAILTTPKSAGRTKTAGDAPEWSRLTPGELAGLGYFRQARCSSCHNLVDGEPKAGPNIAGLNSKKPASEVLAHFKNPDPHGAETAAGLPDAQMTTLLAFVNRLTPERAMAMTSTPQEIISGAQIFAASGCSGCHVVNGAGNAVGPALNGVSTRHTREWVAQHLRNPASQSPNTVMPPFDFSAHDRDFLIDFLFALPVN